MAKFRNRITAAMIITVSFILCGCRAGQEADSSGSAGCDVFADCGTEGTAGSGSFSEKYESLNGQVNSSGKEHRAVSLSPNSIFTETDGETVVSMIENKETFYLYVGDEMCPWCRSVIEMAETVAAEHNITQVYYIEIWDDEGNEVFRDKYELENGEPVKVGEGTEGYGFLLQYFDGYLRDYTLTGEDGETVDAGEKRIYAPNFFYVKDGVPERFTTGRSDKQTDSREELTEEMLEDERAEFEYLFS